MAVKHAKTSTVDDSAESADKVKATNWNADHTIDNDTVTEAHLSIADNTTKNATTSAHGFVPKAVAPAANVLNVVGIANGETAYANKVLFDGTAPAAIGTAAAGTSLSAAHRDHVHAGAHGSLSDIGTLTHAQLETLLGYRYRYPMDFRLTLESSVPISSTDQSAKTTLYLTPYIGNQIGLYYGGAWVTYAIAELSLSLASYTTARVYDIWCYSNSGTPTLDSTIWTNATTRATALAYQDGVLVKSGDATRRYIGSIYMSATGQCSDTIIFRGVWNLYNQTPRDLYVTEGTDHSYATETDRKWNNSDTNNIIKWVMGYRQGVIITLDAIARADATDAVCDVKLFVDGADGDAWVGNYNLGYIEASSLFIEPVAAGYHYAQTYEMGSTAADFGWMGLKGQVWM